MERVKRSAAYFEQTLDKVLTKPLSLVLDIKSQNKLAMKRLTENYTDLRQAWLSRRYLLQQELCLRQLSHHGRKHRGPRWRAS